MDSLRQFVLMIAKVGTLLVLFAGAQVGCGDDDDPVSTPSDEVQCNEFLKGSIPTGKELREEHDINSLEYDFRHLNRDTPITLRAMSADGSPQGTLTMTGHSGSTGDLGEEYHLEYSNHQGDELAWAFAFSPVGAVPSPLAVAGDFHITNTVRMNDVHIGYMATVSINEPNIQKVDEDNPLLEVENASLSSGESTADSFEVISGRELIASEEEIEQWVELNVTSEPLENTLMDPVLAVLQDEKVEKHLGHLVDICATATRRGSLENTDQVRQASGFCGEGGTGETVVTMLGESAFGAGLGLAGSAFLPARLGWGLRLNSAANAQAFTAMFIGSAASALVVVIVMWLGASLSTAIVITGLYFVLPMLVIFVVAGAGYIAACGNPYQRSVTGTAFPFRQRGRFLWYTHSARDTLDIQIRQSPNPASKCEDGARIEATAIRAGEDRIAFYADRDKPLWINGEAQDPRDYYWRHDDRTQIERRTVTEGSEEIYFVTSPAGERLRVDVFGDRLDLEMDVPEELRDGVRGIIGAFSKEGVEGLELRDGTVLEEPVAKRDLYGKFGTSWQVSPEESLFDYQAGEGPEDYQTSGGIPAPRRLEDLDEEQLAYAEYVCDQVGKVSDPTLLRHCLLDVGCTGDSSYMSTYRRIEPPKRSLELVDDGGNPVVGLADQATSSPGWRPDIGAPGGPTGEFAGSHEFDSISQASCPADIEKSAESLGGKRIRTIDGLTYDFQAAGEFVLVESKTDDPLMVQVRQQPRGDDLCPDARRNTAVAAQMGEHRVVFHHFGAPPLQIDGEEVGVIGDFLSLGDGHSITIEQDDEEDDEYLLQWPDGSWLHVEFGRRQLKIKFNSHYSRLGQLQGVFGQFNGYPDNDIALRNGQVLDDWSTEDIHGAFADSWRISQSESLFDYEDGVSTENFTDPSVPSEMMTVGDIPDEEEEAARAHCEDSGVSHSGTLATCIVDVYCADDDEDEADEIAEDLADAEDPVAEIDHDGEFVADDEPEPDDPISEMGTEEIIQACNMLDDHWDGMLAAEGDRMEEGGCKAVAINVTQFNQEDADYCDDNYDTCMDSGEIWDLMGYECALQDWSDDDLEECEANIDEIVDCNEELVEGLFVFADDITCQDHLIGEGDVDEDVVAARELVGREGPVCADVVDDCPALVD